MTRNISRRVAIQALAGTSLAHAAITRPWSTRPKRNYDFVVVGTGYGGSVMAARLAALAPHAAVCVLERGKEWRAGTFPDQPTELFSSVRNAANPGGLFVLNNYPGATLLKASGIGGGSLIDAGVATAPDESIWKHPAWPVAVREDHANGQLEAFYARARNVLGVAPHPRAGQVGKAEALVNSLTQLPGAPARVEAPGLAINWTVDGPNPYGVSVRPCISCGDCLTGCNVGAKNSLDTNYLPMAVNAGAELYGGINIEWIEKLKQGGYRLHVRVYESGGPKSDTVDAANVILAAGSPGSTEILLRSRMHGLSVSPQTGTRFGGNGEVTCAAYGTDHRTDVIGWGSRQSGASAQRLSVVPPGPAVVARVQGQSDTSRGPFWISDLSCPSAMVEAMRAIMALVRGSDGVQDAAAAEKKKALMLIDMDPFGSKLDEGALNYSILYWGIGIEEPVGKFTMDKPLTEPNGRLKLETPPSFDAGRPIFDYIHQRAKTLPLIGIINNVFWPLFFNVRPPVLTQPVGGCPMGETVDKGAVNHRGEVFDGSGGVHSGLYVADASIIPAPLGTGPLLTVAALAERCANLIVKRGWSPQ
jgi:cholesterol oxidase